MASTLKSIQKQNKHYNTRRTMAEIQQVNVALKTDVGWV